MKKKIAVYANGFSMDSLREVLDGIKEYAEKKDFDVFVFLSFASYSDEHGINQGELNIYKLGFIDEFDGAIVLSTHLNSPPAAVEICNRAKEKGVPVVSVGIQIEGVPCVRVTNEDGMRALVTHLVEDHGVKRIAYLGGTADHVDNLARLETTKQVLKEHGLELAEKDITYGDWGNDAARDLVHKLDESEEGLPDAIVAANDIMALAAATELIEMGKKLPDDVIVTGFDNVPYGMVFFPALTTVDQNYKKIGSTSCEILYDMIEGRECPENIQIPSRFVRAESCGCVDQEHYIKLRKKHCQNSYRNHMDSSVLEMYERILSSRIADITDYALLSGSMREHYSRNNTFEGKEFYIVINSEYFEDAVAKEEELFVNGYKEKLEVVVAFKDKKIIDTGKTNCHELVPGYCKKDGEQKFYVFVPLHYYQYNYGYMVFVDDPPIMKLDMLSPYLEKLQQSLKLLRINLRLDALNKDLTRIYNRDPMTGLFNRLAYEQMAVELYDKCVKNKQPMMVMFVDINYMKRINDRYGHLHGDNAIKTVAGSIKYVLKDDWIGVRFGGDEFLIIGSNCDEEGAIAVRHSILAFLELKNHDGSQPYEISASCGYVITDPEIPGSLQDYVKEADNIMYKIKQEVHARDGISRY